MKAGVPLLQSFDIVAKGHANPSVSKLINDIRADVETGTSLNQAFRKFPLYFDPLFCNLVGAGEREEKIRGADQAGNAGLVVPSADGVADRFPGCGRGGEDSSRAPAAGFVRASAGGRQGWTCVPVGIAAAAGGAGTGGRRCRDDHDDAT